MLLRRMPIKCVLSQELADILASPPFGERWIRDLADKGYLVKAGRAKESA